MDVSASFQFVVDALRGEWDVYAPDWRGYGLTGRGKSDCYWFRTTSPTSTPAGTDSGDKSGGAQPRRQCRLDVRRHPAAASRQAGHLEGLPRRDAPRQAPDRYARWLEELHEPPRLRPYRNFQELAERLQQGNRRLTPERADF